MTRVIQEQWGDVSEVFSNGTRNSVDSAAKTFRDSMEKRMMLQWHYPEATLVDLGAPEMQLEQNPG